MTADETLAELKALGTEQTRKTYRRHGAAEPLFGVNYGPLGKLAKKIKSDHELAVALWESGVHEARVLATTIADPARLDSKTLSAWLAGLNSDPIAGAFADAAARAPRAGANAEKWIRSKREWTALAGWCVLSRLARAGELGDEFFAPYIPTIERDIHAAKNRVRYAMNGALIAIGARSAAMRKPALEAAARIGKVEVDHGDTDCKTPDAVEYIKKIVAHQQAKTKAAPASQAARSAKASKPRRNTAKAQSR